MGQVAAAAQGVLGGGERGDEDGAGVGLLEVLDVAALVVEVERAGNTVAGKQALVEALDNILAEEFAISGLSMHLTGTPVLDHRALVLNERDLSRIYPLIVPLVLAICWLAFGSLRLAWVGGGCGRWDCGDGQSELLAGSVYRTMR